MPATAAYRSRAARKPPCTTRRVPLAEGAAGGERSRCRAAGSLRVLQQMAREALAALEFWTGIRRSQRRHARKARLQRSEIDCNAAAIETQRAILTSERRTFHAALERLFRE